MLVAFPFAFLAGAWGFNIVATARNDEDLKSMVLLPRHIVSKQGGVTMVDLAITKTDTYNPYVIMPIPSNVKGGAAGA